MLVLAESPALAAVVKCSVLNDETKKKKTKSKTLVNCVITKVWWATKAKAKNKLYQTMNNESEWNFNAKITHSGQAFKQVRTHKKKGSALTEHQAFIMYNIIIEYHDCLFEWILWQNQYV